MSEEENSFDQVKKALIRQLLAEGANEETLYQALSSLEAARQRKQNQQIANARATMFEKQQPQQSHNILPTQTSRETVAARATVDVFRLSTNPVSPRDRYKTRRHFNNSVHMTGLIGPDTPLVSRKKLLSPRVGSGGYIGNRKNKPVPQYRPTRKREVQDKTELIYKAKNWVDVSDYPAELPSPRSSRKKDCSPRAHAIFGQRRVMPDHKSINTNNIQPVSGSTNGFIRQFSQQQKQYQTSMDMWQTTKGVSTLMPKTEGAAAVDY